MLNDAKARNDVLSQAYTELHAEYLNLRTTRSLNDQHHHHNHHQQVVSYPAAGPAADIGGGYVDPTMAALHAGSDLNVYLYPEVGGYTI